MTMTTALRHGVLAAGALMCFAGHGAAQGVRLGPADARELPPVDSGRVRVGDVAPDFALESLAGSPVTLSRFVGKKNVILVFYRGHW